MSENWSSWGVKCTIEQKKFFCEELNRVSKRDKISIAKSLELIINAYNKNPDIIKSNLQFYKDQYKQLQKDIAASVEKVNKIE